MNTCVFEHIHSMCLREKKKARKLIKFPFNYQQQGREEKGREREKGRHATNLIALKSMVILQAKVINELLPPIIPFPFSLNVFSCRVKIDKA